LSPWLSDSLRRATAAGIFAPVLLDRCRGRRVQLIPGSAYLKIAAEGLTICSCSGKSLISWHDIAEFRVVMIKKLGLNIYKMVAVVFFDSQDRIASRTVGCKGAFRTTTE